MIKALLITAFIFMFNPIISVIDLLPDFIGWLMLFIVVRRVRRISGHFEVAADQIIKMVWLTFAAFVCMFLMPHLDGTMLLTVTFILNVLKIAWGIPAFKHVFDGLEEISNLYDGKSIYKPVGRFSSEGIDLARRLTYVYIVATNVLGVIPDFFELSGQSSVILSEGQRSLLSYKMLAYIIVFILWFIFGIIWLSVMLPFSGRICGEKELIEHVGDAYKQKIADTGKHRAYTLMNAVFAAMLSGLFMLCIMLDEMNIVPRFVMPLLMTVASILAGRCGYKTKKLTFASVLATIVSLTAYILRWNFLIKFSYELIRRSFAAYKFYSITFIAISAELLLLIVVQILFVRLAIDIHKNDAGREYLEINSTKLEEMRKLEHSRYARRIKLSVVLFVITSIFSLCSFVLCHDYPYSWIFVMLSGIVWFVYTDSCYSELRDGIERKYI